MIRREIDLGNGVTLCADLDVNILAGMSADALRSVTIEVRKKTPVDATKQSADTVEVVLAKRTMTLDELLTPTVARFLRKTAKEKGGGK